MKPRFSLHALTALLLSVGLAVALTGCQSYRVERPTAHGTEIVVYRSFLSVGKAANVSALTKDSDYSRSLKVGAVESRGDAELIKSLAEAAAIAAKKAVTP
jgi:hypothetical protein